MNKGIATFAQALSLSSNSYVDIGRCWNDYQDLEVFSFKNTSYSWSIPGTRIKERTYSFSLNTSGSTGVKTVRPNGKPQMLELQPAQVFQICSGLQGKDDKQISLALARWIASKDLEKRHLDSFIDLRIALESLYLRGIGSDKDRGEISFRLSLYGAWHLGGCFEERKRVFNTLRDAYIMASKAVHGSDFEDTPKTQELLSEARNLCRRGILKLLREGPPPDKNDMILGAVSDIDSCEQGGET